MQAVKTDYRQLFAMLKELGIDEEGRRSLIFQFTDAHTTSLKEMREWEIKELTDCLQKQLAIRRTGDNKAQASDKMRKHIIAMARELDWESPSPAGSPPLLKERAGVRSKADMPRIQNWALKYGYLHKKLNDYTYEELPRLVTQFQKMYNDTLKKIK